MRFVPTAEKLLHQFGGGGVPVRAGCMAGADRHLPHPTGLGMDRSARGDRRGTRNRMAAVQALQRHALLRGEVDHETPQ